MASTSSLSLFSSTVFDSNLHINSSKTLKSLIVKTKPRSSRRTPTIRVELATLPVLTFSGEKSGEAMLDLREAWPDTARSVIHRGLITDLQNKRRGTASTLTRAEVSGGGRKPLRQKGSGRARMGSIRTPLRPGGGVIFGPRPKDWSIKMNKKEKRLAISTALMSAAVNSVVVEDFDGEFSEKPRTKEFVAAMKRWGVDPSSPALIFCMEVSENVMLSSRNIGTVKVLTPRTLNLFDVLNAEKLIFTRSGVEYLNQMYGVDASLEVVDDGDGEEDEDVEEK